MSDNVPAVMSSFFFLFFGLFVCLFVETESLVAQAGLELLILLLVIPKCQHYQHVPPCQALLQSLLFTSLCSCFPDCNGDLIQCFLSLYPFVPPPCLCFLWMLYNYHIPIQSPILPHSLALPWFTLLFHCTSLILTLISVFVSLSVCSPLVLCPSAHHASYFYIATLPLTCLSHLKCQPCRNFTLLFVVVF